MMAGNPNWWSMNGMHPQLSTSPQFVYASSNNSSFPPNLPQPEDDDDHHHHPNQDFPVRSWSQLLMGGILSGGGEEERFSASTFQQQKKLENWEDQVLLNLNPATSSFTTSVPCVDHDVKEEVAHHHQLYGHHHDEVDDELIHLNRPPASNRWINQVMPVSSPTSCITTNLSNNNFLNFSGSNSGASATAEVKSNHQRHQDQSECNSSGSGGVAKKARVQQSSAQPALKVRKEKLGDRITALHQLVSPFGKTDTASVLTEAIGCIRSLQGQIEALSTPYMRNASESTGNHQHSFFNHEIGIDARGEPKQDSQGGRGVSKDLRSRGLCLVPISCTHHVGNDVNGADYWAPAAALGGGGF